MVGALVLNYICGFVFLVPLCFVLPPIEDVIVASSPVPYILKIAIGNDGGAFALTIPLLVLAIFCGIGCTTAASRCTWAFARDGAIPGSKYWKTVNPRLDVPFNAMMLSMVIQIILGVIYFGSVAAFNAFSGVGVIFLVSSSGHAACTFAHLTSDHQLHHANPHVSNWRTKSIEGWTLRLWNFRSHL